MKLIVLDRDGVINHDSHNYIRHPDDWHPIDRSLDALKKLNDAGYTVVVCTNQSGIARGYYDEATLEQIHQKMHASVESHGGKIDQVYYCPHLPTEGCRCRKPQPGLLEQIASDYGVDMQDKIMIGDRISDMQAALSMNMQAILVKTGLTEQPQTDPVFSLVTIYDDLYSAIDALLK